MPASPEIIAFVLLLLPGLSAVWLFNALTPATKPDTMTKIAAVVILSVISYLMLWGLSRLWAWMPDPTAALSASDGQLSATLTIDTLMAVVAATFIASVMAMIGAKAHQHDIAYTLFGKLGLSTRQGMSSHWDRVMHSALVRKHWAMIVMKNGTAYTGWIKAFSDGTSERSLLLVKVKQYDDDEESFDWPDDETLFFPTLADVQCLRFIPKETKDNEQERSSKRTKSTSGSGGTTPQGSEYIEYKSEQAPSRSTAPVSDQAKEGQVEVGF